MYKYIVVILMLAGSSAFAWTGNEVCSDAEAAVRISYDRMGIPVIELAKDNRFEVITDIQLIEHKNDEIVVSESISNDCVSSNKKPGEFTYDLLNRELVRQVTIKQKAGLNLPGKTTPDLTTRVFCKISTMIPSKCK